MNSVKSELALANAQELMNVRLHSISFNMCIPHFEHDRRCYRKQTRSVSPNASQNRLRICHRRRRCVFCLTTSHTTSY